MHPLDIGEEYLTHLEHALRRPSHSAFIVGRRWADDGGPNATPF